MTGEKMEFIDNNLSTINTLKFFGGGEEYEEYGALYIDDNGKLSFKGDVNESAKVLLSAVCDLFNRVN